MEGWIVMGGRKLRGRKIYWGSEGGIVLGYYSRRGLWICIESSGVDLANGYHMQLQLHDN